MTELHTIDVTLCWFF